MGYQDAATELNKMIDHHDWEANEARFKTMSEDINALFQKPETIPALIESNSESELLSFLAAKVIENT